MTTHHWIIPGVLSLILAGCSSDEADAVLADRMVYVDTKTGQAVVRDVVSPVPAVNPETNERTLMPGLYCPTCQKWYPVPPPEQINSRPNAGQCPNDRTPLTADGPWPDSGADDR